MPIDNTGHAAHAEYFKPEYYQGKVPVFDPQIFNTTPENYAKGWPIKLEGTRLILNLLAGDGREQPVPHKISAIMESLMPPADAKSPRYTDRCQ